MIGRAVERVGMAVLTVWIAASLAFFALEVIPGDAIVSQLTQSGASASAIEERRAEMGLTDPVWVRYGRFFDGVVRGDWGQSLLSHEPVVVTLARNLPPTITLAFSALLVATVAGIVVGVAGALKLPLISSLSRVVVSISLSMPIYWTGTIAIFVFTARLGLLPSAGAGRLSQLVLPVTVLAFHASGAVARVVQGNVATVLLADFVRTARSKGLSERQVLFGHALRAALLPVISVVALQAGFLLGGTVIVESLFVRPGIGRLLLDATLQQDYPVVLGVVLWSAAVYTLLNLAADVLFSLLDPRVSL